MRISRRLALFVLTLLFAVVVTPVTAENDSVLEVFEDDFGADPEQAQYVRDNLMPVDDVAVYRFGDDPTGSPTLSSEEAGYIDPVAMGAFLFQWNDPSRVPDFGDIADPSGDGLAIDVNGGIQPGQPYVVFTAVMSEPIPYGPNDDERFKNFAFIISLHDHEGWVPLDQFPGDTWSAAAFVLNMVYGPNPWEAFVYEVIDGSLRPTNTDGAVYVGSNVFSFAVNANLFGNQMEWVGFGWAGHVHEGDYGASPNGLSRIATAPPTPRSQGDTFPGRINTQRLIQPGFEPRADITDVWVIVDEDGMVWLNLKTSRPWGDKPPDDLFSIFINAGISSGSTGAFLGWQTHAGVQEMFSSGPTGETEAAGWIMSDGSILMKTPLKAEDLEFPAILQIESGFLPTEDGQLQSGFRTREINQSDLQSGDPMSHDGTFPVYDLATEEMLEPPASAVTTTQPASTTETTQSASTTETTQPASTTETTQPASTTETTPSSTTTRERDGTRERPGSEPVCWSCWAILLVFLLFLIWAIYTWYKVEEWWTCWVPWFLVIFIWVPFVLAGLIFWAPWWWWLPLLIWFPFVFGYTWWWAQKRTWWRPQYWYLLYGWGALAVIGLFLAGPWWWYLLPLFWLPFVGFWAWYRARRFPWWAPWMWLLLIGWVAWGFIWVIWLTPWWAWWFPFAWFPIWGWWVWRAQYTSWTEFSRKYCWILPFSWLPWLAYMLLLYCLKPTFLG